MNNITRFTFPPCKIWEELQPEADKLFEQCDKEVQMYIVGRYKDIPCMQFWGTDVIKDFVSFFKDNDILSSRIYYTSSRSSVIYVPYSSLLSKEVYNVAKNKYGDITRAFYMRSGTCSIKYPSRKPMINIIKLIKNYKCVEVEDYIGVIYRQTLDLLTKRDKT